MKIMSNSVYLGMRFAQLEVKIAVYEIVKNFVIEPSAKTPIPVKFAATGTVTPLGGMWLQFKPRSR